MKKVLQIAVWLGIALLGLAVPASAELSVDTLTTNTVQGVAVTIPYAALINQAHNATGKVEVVMLMVGGSKMGHGTIKVKQDSFVYTPARDFAGTDSFKYVLADEKSKVTGTVSIQVTADTSGKAKKEP
jgi:hypothetical protein